MRIVIYDCVVGNPDSHSAYMTYTAKNVIRVLSHCDGYEYGYWGEDPETGKMAAITLWTSLEAIDAADPRLERFHQERERLGVSVVSANNFKLLSVSAGPHSWINDASDVSDRLRQEAETFSGAGPGNGRGPNGEAASGGLGRALPA